MIALSAPRGHDVLASLRDHDPVVQRYRAFFAYLDWTVVPEREATRPWPGSLPHPTSAYVKVPDRYNPQRQPPDDPDCRPGVKTSSNQVQADGTTKLLAPSLR
jgi:hypothetical protein